MPWQSVNDILGKLEIQAHIRAQPFQRVLQVWKEVVGDRTAAHTRPVAINRQVLKVAASSAARAQNFMFQRQQVLQALNARLEQPLSDIRCSTGGWHVRVSSPNPSVLLNEHPSYVDNSLDVPVSDSLNPPVLIASEDIQVAFDRWARLIQAGSQNLPQCPKCQAPTPAGEIARWGCCSLCAAKSFAQNQ